MHSVVNGQAGVGRWARAAPRTEAAVAERGEAAAQLLTNINVFASRSTDTPRPTTP
jgi:hypothetical protein